MNDQFLALLAKEITSLKKLEKIEDLKALQGRVVSTSLRMKQHHFPHIIEF